MDNRHTPPGSLIDQDYLPLSEEALQHSIVDRFEYIAAHFPDQLAIRSREQSLTFHQLNEASNRLAHAIMRLRGTETEPVAFILEHGASAIISMLGVLKAGKAYVPVDPFYPPAWMTQILDDTHAELLLTNFQNLPLAMTSLVNPDKVTILNLDTLEDNLPADNPGVQTASTEMSYILYTSGSTGAPKGAIHTHRDVLHNAFALGSDLHLSPGDRFALFITLGFEASRFSLTGALMNGGTLCLYDIRSLGLGGLPEWIVQEQISVLLTTPSTFRHMFNLVPKDLLFSSVHTIVFGGESVTSHDVALFRSHFPKNCTLVNTLGMTETGIIARMKINHQSVLKGHNVPAGYTVGDKKIVLVDESGQPVPPGEVGEILVKSHYLAPGYWRLPSLTAERFSNDPEDETVRIFRTGDLGRLRPDGCLEHLGRKDSQIKIRGFRVDPAEIEAVLQQYPGVKNSAVIARELKHTPGNLQLVAYIESEDCSTLVKKVVRSFLASQLPDYMVPTLIVLLDKLPLTPTGKVNRLTLPEPETLGQGLEQSYIAPRDSIEVQLVKIWEKVLKTRPIGVQDDYFELGGNSLLAAQLFTQVEKTFGKKLPLATLFQAATVEDQANILRQDDWIPNWSSLVALRSGGSKTPLFCAAPVGGNVLSYHDLMMHLDPEIPIYGLQAIGLDGMQTVHRNVNEIAAHYIKEILNVQSDGPFYLSGSSFGGLVAYEMAQQIHDLGQQVALVAMFDAYGPNYPRRLPSTSRMRRKFFKYLRRIDTHLSNLRFTNWQGRVTYVRVKLPKFYNRLARRVKDKVDQILHPVPRQLARIRNAHMNAARRKKRYMREERRFDGRLVLFRAEKQPLGIYPDPKLGWSVVVGDNIEVYEIPGHHTSIIYEPRVHILAEKLSQVLSETHSEQARR
jgi:amino acid adenylation domain-containing protein